MPLRGDWSPTILLRTTETSRFSLREFRESDVEDFFELDSDPEVHRFLGNKPVKTRDEVTEKILLVRRQYEEFGIGRWAVVDKETTEAVSYTHLTLPTICSV